MIKYSLIAIVITTFIGTQAAKASGDQTTKNPQRTPILTSNQKISDLLNTSLINYPGRLIELERKQTNSAVYYKVKILSVQGNIIELSFQATGTGFREIKKEREHAEKEQVLLRQQTLSLNQILKGISFKTLLDAELKPHQKQAQYEVKWLDPHGHINHALFDAKTGQKINR